jgi:Ca2+-binding EF-hand superfamily protein
MTRISVILTALVLLATPLAGCLDEAALEDLIDDVIGCMDENAKNYEDNATTELVGECIYAASMQTFLDSMNQQMGIEELLEQSPSAGYSMSMTMPMDGEDMGLEETIIMNVQETVKVNLSSNSAYVSMHIGIPLMLTSVSTMIQVGEVVNVHNELSGMMVTQMGAETVDDSYQTRDASPNVMEWVLPMLADSMISDDDMMDDEGEDDMMDDLDMMNATMSFTLDTVTNSQTMHLSSTNETGDTLNLTILIDESQNLMSYSMVQSNATSEMHMSYAVMWGDAISITADETLPRTSIPVYWDGLSMSGSDDGDGDEEMFLCDSGEEIPEDWVNDGEEDCYDGSDESEDDDNDPPTPEEAMDDVDANDDGYMSYQEFQDSWESENFELDWDEVATLFDDCDYDDNDLIDIDEMQCFVDGIVDMLPDGGDENPEQMFGYIDTDDDGYVSLQDIIDFSNNNEEGDDSDDEIDEEELSNWFSWCDTDGDDLLNLDEFTTCFDEDDGEVGAGYAFDSMDTDENGEVTASEWADLTNSSEGIEMSEEHFEALSDLMDMYDYDGSGGLDWDEFEDAWDDCCADDDGEGGDSDASPEEIMDYMDADDDGYVSLQEFIDHINNDNDQNGEPPMTSEEEDGATSVFDNVDSDGDGLLDFDEFIALLESFEDDGECEPSLEMYDDAGSLIGIMLDDCGQNMAYTLEVSITNLYTGELVSFYTLVGLLYSEIDYAIENFSAGDYSVTVTIVDYDGNYVNEENLFITIEDMFTCDDGEEIPANWENDGEVDCYDGSDEVPEIFDLDLTVASNQTFEAPIGDFEIRMLECDSDIRADCNIIFSASLTYLIGTIGNSDYTYTDVDMDGMISAEDTLEITDMDPNYEFDLYDSWSDSYVSESAVNGPNMPGFGGLLATISMLGAAFLLPRRDD